jgi:hypothetical protein
MMMLSGYNPICKTSKSIILSQQSFQTWKLSFGQKAHEYFIRKNQTFMSFNFAEEYKI